MSFYSSKPLIQLISSCRKSSLLPNETQITGSGCHNLRHAMANAASAPSSVKRGRKEGTPSWVPIEDVIAYIACNHADEKFAESGKDERALNAKTFFDSEIVKDAGV